MPESHISNDAFFVRLSELFEERRKQEHGSVFLSQKRMSYGEPIERHPHTTDTDLFQDIHTSKPLPLIIRATDGKSKDKRADRVKLSTIVEADSLEAFFVRYADVSKFGMSGLKKRDRSKRREKLKAKKKKGGPTLEDTKKS